MLARFSELRQMHYTMQTTLVLKKAVALGRTDYFDGLTPDIRTAKILKLRNVGDPSV
jgi:hypothetical protein